MIEKPNTLNYKRGDVTPTRMVGVRSNKNYGKNF